MSEHDLPDRVDGAVDRRAFLGLLGAAGAGLILGAGRGAWADEEEAKAAWKQALARMKQLRLDGVVVVIPKDKAGRSALVAALSRLIEITQMHEAAPPAAGLLLSCVWVCASAEQAGAKPGETLVLLDPQGKRLDGAAIDLGAKDALARIRALVDGKQGERRQARVERVREDRKLAAALDDVAAKGSVSRGAVALQERLDEAAPALVDLAERTKEPGEVKGTLDSMLGRAYWQRLNAAQAFPYGVQWKVEVDQPEPCPPCGMAMPSMTGRKFIRYLCE
ncbi:MAG: hypothetical protein AB7N76_14195 [Planctomycetota bacterium]